MNSSETPSTARVAYSSAHEANRRIAGVAASARVVRELSKAGFATAWVELPSGEALDTLALEDLRHLAGAIEVRVGSPPGNAEVCQVPSNRLIRAEEVPAFLAGCAIAPQAELRLDAADATAQVLRRTVKDSDGPVSRWLNRPISRRLSALFLRIPGFTPFHATLGTALLAAAMFLSLVAGGPAGLVAGGLLFQAASIFDGVDGEIARATFRSSPAGARLDSVVDMVTTVLFLVGLAFNLDSVGRDSAVMLAGWGLGLFIVGVALLRWRAGQRDEALNLDFLKDHYRSRFAGALGSRVMAFLTIVSSRDFFALLFAVLIAAGFAMAPLYIFAAAATVWLPFVAVSALAPRNAALSAENA